MTRHIRLTVLGAIAGLRLVVPVSTQQGTPQSRTQGLVFHTALGHRDDIWSNDAVFREHIKGGIRWALGLE